MIKFQIIIDNHGICSGIMFTSLFSRSIFICRYISRNHQKPCVADLQRWVEVVNQRDMALDSLIQASMKSIFRSTARMIGLSWHLFLLQENLSRVYWGRVPHTSATTKHLLINFRRECVHPWMVIPWPRLTKGRCWVWWLLSSCLQFCYNIGVHIGVYP